MVYSNIGIFDQGFCIFSIIRVQANAYTGYDLQVMTIELEWLKKQIEYFPAEDIASRSPDKFSKIK